VTVLLFPDNTVLINFAILNRMDLLGSLANGNGQWCATVAEECANSTGFDGLGALADAPSIFGEPLRPDRAELQDAYILREELAQPGDPRYKHLGEAETIAIMQRRQLRGFFVTDDNDARRMAARHGVKIATTWILLKMAWKVGRIDADTLWGYVQTLGRQSRGTPPVVTDRSSFDAWLQG
jgi:predicted nucleic acid-binding protein